MQVKIRPAVLLGEFVMGTIACLAIVYGDVEIAVGAVTGIAATIHKLVESEEKGEL